MYDVKVKKLKDSEEIIRYALVSVLRHLVAGCAAFLFSSASFQGLAPFGAAFVACVFPEYIPVSVLGCAMGYFYIYGATILMLRYTAACAVSGILSYIFKRNIKRKYHNFFSAASSFVPVFSTGLIISMSVTLSADEIVLYFAEGLMGGAGAYFFDRFLSIKPSKRCVSRLTGTETASLLIVFAVLLLSLSSFKIFMISPAVIAGVYAVLIAASFGGDKFGALFGIVSGVMLGFGTQDMFLTGGIALGGLLCGFFGKQNRIISALIFAVTVSVTAFAGENPVDSLYILYSVGIGTSAFVLTPKKIAKAFRSFFAFPNDGENISSQRNVLRMRLKTASDSMNDVTRSVKAVAGIYRRRSTPREENIYKNVESIVCRSCSGYESCWKTNPVETRGNFSALANALRHNSVSMEDGLSARFFNTCIYPEKVVKSLSYEVEKHRTAMREAVKTGETVNIVSDQFGAVAQLLSEFSENMATEEEFDGEKTAVLSDVLINDMELEISSCGVFRNEENKYFCEFSFRERSNINDAVISEAVSEVLGIRFEKPVVRRLNDGTAVYSLCEKTKYSVVTSGFQISSDSGKWCGDTFDSFTDGKGKLYLILSDGMGTGKKAAADSVLCCSLASVLLRAQYPVECIIKMINSAMLVRSGEESLATLDIAIFNLYNGNLSFYKAGAAPSVALKHLKMLKIEKPSLPVGILGNVNFEKIELNLRDGDSFVLMSDGVSEDSFSAWRDLMKNTEESKENELAQTLAKTARMNNSKDNPDDITVVTAVIGLNG